jgi:tRNA A-37 threonylcarbamoyl transferase component Bud32
MRSAEDAVFSPGEEFLGKYRVERMLGRGGMGEVYLARNQFLDQPVAIKVLPLKRSAEDLFRERMKREAQAGARLAHDNLVKVIDGGITDDNLVYIVMEFLDGAKTLRELVWRTRGFELVDALAYAIQLLDGLAAVHAAGILHRDLKPENVVVLPGGRVKIIDFGLAKIRTSALRTTVVPEGQRMGTLHYMAPEQILGGDVGPGADIYAAGLILHEMVAGQHVFSQETDLLPSVQEVSIMHQLASPTRLDARKPGVPKELADVVERMLAKESAARPTALEAGAALERVLASVSRAAAEQARAPKQGARGTMMLPEGFVPDHPLGPFAPTEAVATLTARALEGWAARVAMGHAATATGGGGVHGGQMHGGQMHGGQMHGGQMRGAPPPDLASGATPSPVATTVELASKRAHRNAAVAGVVCGVALVGALFTVGFVLRGGPATAPAASAAAGATTAAPSPGDGASAPRAAATEAERKAPATGDAAAAVSAPTPVASASPALPSAVASSAASSPPAAAPTAGPPPAARPAAPPPPRPPAPAMPRSGL